MTAVFGLFDGDPCPRVGSSIARTAATAGERRIGCIAATARGGNTFGCMGATVVTCTPKRGR